MYMIFKATTSKFSYMNSFSFLEEIETVMIVVPNELLLV